jgi:MoxR-like ATPase
VSSPHSQASLCPSGEALPAPAALERSADVVARLRRRLTAQILGRDEVIDLVLVALLADGHVLLEDFPGSGKTTLAKALGHSIVDDRPRTRSRTSAGSSSRPICCPRT